MPAVNPSFPEGSTTQFARNTSATKQVALTFAAVTDGDTYTDANLANVSVTGWAVSQPNSITDYGQVTSYAPTTGVFTFGISANTPALTLIIWMSN